MARSILKNPIIIDDLLINTVVISRWARQFVLQNGCFYFDAILVNEDGDQFTGSSVYWKQAKRFNLAEAIQALRYLRQESDEPQNYRIRSVLDLMIEELTKEKSRALFIVYCRIRDNFWILALCLLLTLGLIYTL